MARHIVCVLDRTVGHVSFCWDYVSIFIYKNSNYNKINQITEVFFFYFVQFLRCPCNVKPKSRRKNPSISSPVQSTYLFCAEVSIKSVGQSILCIYRASRHVIATIAQYIYHHHDSRLPTLATLLLKRVAMVYPMSILACLGNDAEPIRDIYMARLQALTEVKVLLYLWFKWCLLADFSGYPLPKKFMFATTFVVILSRKMYKTTCRGSMVIHTTVCTGQ